MSYLKIAGYLLALGITVYIAGKIIGELKTEIEAEGEVVTSTIY
jgi:hypothetical protein